MKKVSFCSTHRCICCGLSITHGIVENTCTLPTDMTCSVCSDSEGEGSYCWACDVDNRSGSAN